MIHLTHTSFLAGQTLCGAKRKQNENYSHAVQAPLYNAEYRKNVCPNCLMEYALSFEEDEIVPEWAQKILAAK